jgi:hypothetical protein
MRVWRDATTLDTEAIGATAEFLVTWGSTARHEGSSVR